MSPATQRAIEMMRATIPGVVAEIEARGARHYRRDAAFLRGLIRTDDLDLSDASPTTRALIVSRLERALEIERELVTRGHWTASINRPLAIRQAIAGEARQ